MALARAGGKRLGGDTSSLLIAILTQPLRPVQGAECISLLCNPGLQPQGGGATSHVCEFQRAPGPLRIFSSLLCPSVSWNLCPQASEGTSPLPSFLAGSGRAAETSSVDPCVLWLFCSQTVLAFKARLQGTHLPSIGSLARNLNVGLRGLAL